MSSEMMDRLLDGGDDDYLDPLATADDGADYGGTWIAAIQPVELPRLLDADDRPEKPSRSSTQADNADLLVLVQYRLEKVMEPVHQMRSALLLEGTTALASILAVTLTLWFLVHRVSSSGTAESLDTTQRNIVPSGSTETMPVN